MDEIHERLSVVEKDLAKLKDVQKFDADVADNMIRNLEYDVEQVEDAVKGLEKRMALVEEGEPMMSDSSQN